MSNLQVKAPQPWVTAVCPTDWKNLRGPRWSSHPASGPSHAIASAPLFDDLLAGRFVRLLAIYPSVCSRSIYVCNCIDPGKFRMHYQNQSPRRFRAQYDCRLLLVTRIYSMLNVLITFVQYYCLYTRRRTKKIKIKNNFND